MKIPLDNDIIARLEIQKGNCMSEFIGDQFSLVTQSCLTLHNPMDCSMPGFPVLHHLMKLAQTHIH